LVHELKPGQIVLYDNAAFHESKEAIKMIEAVGCKVIRLPKYSPKLNPIEHWWSPVKTNIKTVKDNYDSFYNAAVDVLGNMCVN